MKRKNYFGQYVCKVSGRKGPFFIKLLSSSALSLAIPFFCTSISTAQSGWTTQLSGTTSNLHAITSPPASNRQFAVGDSGIILFTENNGETWISVPTGISASLSAISFPNADTGFAVGDQGTILKVGRESVNPLTSGIDVTLRSVAAIRDPLNRTAYVVGDSGTILRT